MKLRIFVIILSMLIIVNSSLIIYFNSMYESIERDIDLRNSYEKEKVTIHYVPDYNNSYNEYKKEQYEKLKQMEKQTWYLNIENLIKKGIIIEDKTQIQMGTSHPEPSLNASGSYKGDNIMFEEILIDVPYFKINPNYLWFKSVLPKLLLFFIGMMLIIVIYAFIIKIRKKI